ncbi:MAG TPA: hypothetical protein VFP11_05260 [Candidatus Angelobacter sp.]|nr:hypothetical protein [Candidatus Angelobacter sp.]
MPSEPTKVTIRMFNVGFGDCFLLTFHYARPIKDQSILIDFGSVGGKADMKGIAADIKEACGGKLYAVVATHRHKDHISGFSNAGGKESAGAIIASCKPEVVLQPWTENPDAAANATSAPLLAKQRKAGNKQLYFASLSAMNAVAEAVVRQAARWRGVSSTPGMLEKLAANAVKNPDAVKNLRTMGKKPARFLQYGSKSGLESKLLPGVKIHVLGPPTLEQQNLKKYAKNSDEYWLASKYWGLQERAVALAGGSDLFPREKRYEKKSRPFHTRWFSQHADAALKSSTLAIVTVLDSFLNNTSLILLFEVKGKKLLFPGDAQWENWSWALSQKGVQDLLKDVDVYKVGHHGSRNATPKTLWNLFSKRKGKQLHTMMSTAAGVYGRTAEGKVPAPRLVKDLNDQSDLLNTQKLRTKRGPLQLDV